MSTQHTPGPWEIVSDHKSPRIESDRGEFVCVASVDAAGFVGLRFPSGGADGPDAHLIAAAPDMYEALKSIVEDHEFCGDDWGDRRDAWIETARAVLAKAEGKS